jgi:hypothetical protein
VGEVGGSGGVAGAAADDQRPECVTTSAYLPDVVGGEVGGRVGWLSGPAGAPVAEEGAVVGDQAAPALAFSVVVEVGALGSLGLVLDALAVTAAVLASDGAAAADAGAEQATAHRRLRRLRWRSFRLQSSQRSPQVMGRLQPRQRSGARRAPVGAL